MRGNEDPESTNRQVRDPGSFGHSIRRRACRKGAPTSPHSRQDRRLYCGSTGHLGAVLSCICVLEVAIGIIGMTTFIPACCLFSTVIVSLTAVRQRQCVQHLYIACSDAVRPTLPRPSQYLAFSQTSS
ncbi:hypothetical protein BDV98DRAFT_167499 [Pterulicium gracile]|uniref:Uncharacterized protein n=1 Tax=Pterulicium gracile TaxID=1884261 RepID=A0A5C3QCH1_9AGAR|nr:hypothetical protein BDV98DRAFT_167499 [Pterula gracilis]